MKLRVLAAMLGIGCLLFSGCSADRAGTARYLGAATPLGIIRSHADLERYLATTAESRSPLTALSTDSRARFLASLTFNEKGITGFAYGDLQRELTASQIFDVLRLFRVEKDIAIIPAVRIETAADRRVVNSLIIPPDSADTDHKDYWCAARGTCSTWQDLICTSNC